MPIPEKNAKAAVKIHVAGLKAWAFRLLAFIAVPGILLVLCELGLRLVGFGYPTGFLLPSHYGQSTFIQNNKFGWRFFGPQLARLPYSLSIAQPKPPGTTRIFVFGESAAKGDPKPYFGLPRMLQAMLSLRHPCAHIEVENVAMTAINSHVVLMIARDCAVMDGDIWVVYMGNNEVVGPFGAGTVFGRQTPPLPLIRGGLAMKATRVGQLLDAFRQWMEKSSAQRDVWRGMKMFLDQQVRADGPRMDAVYRYFKQNLADIIQTGRNAGVGIVVSTVAVNLKDCAPFASEHGQGLSEQPGQSGIISISWALRPYWPQTMWKLRSIFVKRRRLTTLSRTFVSISRCAMAMGRDLRSAARFPDGAGSGYAAFSLRQSAQRLGKASRHKPPN